MGLTHSTNRIYPLRLVDRELAMTRSRCLFVVAIKSCDEPNAGGPQRTHLLFDALCERYDVDMLIVGTGVADFHKSPFPKASAIFEGLYWPPSQTSFLAPLLKFLPSKIADKIAAVFIPRADVYAPDAKMRETTAGLDPDSYDLIVGRHFLPIARSGVLTRAEKTPVLIDIDDRDDFFFRARIGAGRFNPIFDALNAWHARQVNVVMEEKLPLADHLWIVSEDDGPGLANPSISLLPNIPFNLPEEEPILPSGKTILFVGTYVFDSNVYGVKRFIENIWPTVHAAEPDATFRIVGGGWDGLSSRYKDVPGVELAGYVPDLAEAYRDAVMVVSPIYDGAGTKIKVIEALGYGRPVIASDHSARGVARAVDEGSVVGAANDASMASEIVKLLQDEERAGVLGKKGRAFVLETLSRKRFTDIVHRDCDAVMARSGGDNKQTAATH